MNSIVELEDVSKKYGDRSALGRVSVAVNAGDFLLVRGPSGAGKSTLLGILTLMLLPTTGEVRLRGRGVSAAPEGKRDQMRGSLFGIVPQFPRLFQDLTALHNIEIAATRRRPRRWAELLRSVGLSGAMDTRAGLLSGGEQQRLSLARALVNSPEVIVADEPTSGLDDRNAADLAGLLADLARYGTAVVVATHDGRLSPHATRTLELGMDGDL